MVRARTPRSWRSLWHLAHAALRLVSQAATRPGPVRARAFLPLIGATPCMRSRGSRLTLTSLTAPVRGGLPDNCKLPVHEADGHLDEPPRPALQAAVQERGPLPRASATREQERPAEGAGQGGEGRDPPRAVRSHRRDLRGVSADHRPSARGALPLPPIPGALGFRASRAGRPAEYIHNRIAPPRRSKRCGNSSDPRDRPTPRWGGAGGSRRVSRTGGCDARRYETAPDRCGEKQAEADGQSVGGAHVRRIGHADASPPAPHRLRAVSEHMRRALQQGRATR